MTTAAPRRARRRGEDVEVARQPRRHHRAARTRSSARSCRSRTTTMWSYWTLLTDLRPHEIDALKADVASGAQHPKRVKMDLAAPARDGLPRRRGRRDAPRTSSSAASRADGPVKAETVVLPDPAPADVASLLVALGLAAEQERGAAEGAGRGRLDLGGRRDVRRRSTTPRSRSRSTPGAARYVRLGKRFLRVAR